MSPPSTYIIAEMACSHDGSPTLARKIIDGAGQAGADAIQFQIWRVADIVVPHHPEYAKLEKIELSRKDWSNLAHHVRDRYPEMQIVACVYERSSVDFCESIGVDAYKLHASDLSNPFLVKYTAGTGKRIDLSVGASTMEEIGDALGWIGSASHGEIWLMHCYQNFPTPVDKVHLRYLTTLKDRFELPVGYQDHTDADTPGAFWLPAAAVGLGVEILEKHITHDRSLKGLDHEAALNPEEFVRFVQMVRTIEAAMGDPAPRPFSEEELKYRTYSKKSVVASHDLAANTPIAAEDLLILRADELGLPPDQADRLIGRMTRRAIAAYHVIREEDVA